MQKDLRLTILVMALFSILLFLLIIGPEVNGTTEAANNNVDSLKSDVVDSSGDEPTKSAIEKDDSLSDVTCEITEPEVAFQLKYDKYPFTYTYLLVQNDTINIRRGPSVTEPVLKAVPKNEKLNYIETITNDGKWYHVTWNENNQQFFGFINADVVIKRVFQFDKMAEAIRNAEKAYDNGPLTYINNYHNLRGNAPMYQGEELDKNGGRRSQSAPGYPDLAHPDEFSYLGDGTLVRVLSPGAQYTRVALVKDKKVYFVPSKYVVTPAAITAIKKAVVIDRENQNEVVFEKIGQEWNVISYTLATTGATGKYQQPTPLGYFYGIEKRERFYYYKDGTTTIQGYAPYVIRFAGGAYIHGVPVNYKFNANGDRIDPGKIEYSRSLGTVPLSHKCVRNFTSHAKFIYDWYTPGEMIVIVME
ncbi:MAG TPA: L,D-transpeptidase family protein [Anaerovoracaceae bacterium]|nr:L,D-transpeptidase family protein [Anaerovoracaceae bacterium]